MRWVDIVENLWIMGIQGTILIGVVLILRQIMKRYPKKYSYLLWLLVLVRLLCPIFLESSISLQPNLRQYINREQDEKKTGIAAAGKLFFLICQTPEQGNLDDSIIKKQMLGKMDDADAAGSAYIAKTEGDTTKAGNTDDKEKANNPGNPDSSQNTDTTKNIENIEDAGSTNNIKNSNEQQMNGKYSTNGGADKKWNTLNSDEVISVPEQKITRFKTNAVDILEIIYLLGIVITAFFCIVQYIRLRKRTAEAIRTEKGIWQSEQIGSPFVLGVFRPKIFLPYHIPEKERIYILQHERMHIRHRDPLLRLLGMTAACLHWWNPAIWYAVRKLNQDMEMYCDEAVLADASIQKKKEYSAALLHFSMRQSGLEIALTFGESNTEVRVRNIMKNKKRNIVIAGSFFLLVVICTALFLTVPKKSKDIDSSMAGKSHTEGDMPENGGDVLLVSNSITTEPVHTSEPNSTTKPDHTTKPDNIKELDHTTEPNNITELDNTTEPNNITEPDHAKESDSVWEQIKDFTLSLPDENGLVESKLIPDRMGPYSVIYFMDDTHFLIMAGELFYTTQDAVETRKTEWQMEAAQYEQEGKEYPLMKRPQTGVCVVYDWQGCPKEVYKPIKEEKAWEKAKDYDAHIAFMEKAKEARQQNWERLEDFAMPVLDKNGLVESKLAPDKMLPGSKIYYADDSHFIILSGGLYYDTPEKIDLAKENWQELIRQSENQEAISVIVPDYAKAGSYIDYTMYGYAHRIYEDKTMEESIQRALWDSQNVEVILRHGQNVPWSSLTDLEGVTLWLLDEDCRQYEISYQYNLEGAQSFQGEILMADVNFDGREDILIDTGKYKEDDAHYYACFLWSEEEQNYIQQDDIVLSSRPIESRLIYKEEMRYSKAEVLEGTWQITGCAGAASVYGLSAEEQEEIIGSNIAYRSKLHRQYQEHETEYFLSLQPDLKNNGWEVGYGNADWCVLIEQGQMEQMTKEEFLQAWKVEPASLGLTDDIITGYHITDGYDNDSGFGNNCYMLDDKTMLICYYGVFFTAQKFD